MQSRREGKSERLTAEPVVENLPPPHSRTTRTGILDYCSQICGDGGIAQVLNITDNASGSCKSASDLSEMVIKSTADGGNIATTANPDVTDGNS